MSDFSTAWTLSRSRLLDTISNLNEAQLNWRIHPQSLTIGEMAIHVAGVEVSFASQLLDLQLNSAQTRLKECATDGVVNDKPFPFLTGEVTPITVAAQLAMSKEILEPLITSPTDEVLQKEIVSALGPVITGEGAFARLAFHSAYHQGQAYLIVTAPNFPA